MCVSAVRLFEIRELDERVTINSRSGLEFGNGLGEYFPVRPKVRMTVHLAKWPQNYGLGKQKTKTKNKTPISKILETKHNNQTKWNKAKNKRQMIRYLSSQNILHAESQMYLPPPEKQR